jgi:hypothetical protein
MWSWIKQKLAIGPLYSKEVNIDIVYPAILKTLNAPQDKYFLEVCRRCVTTYLKEMGYTHIKLVSPTGAMKLKNNPGDWSDADAGAQAFRQYYGTARHILERL